jgi:hypothetical protein
MSTREGGVSTCIGDVVSVRGGVVTVRLRPVASTLLMVAGESYRLGQIGGYLRIPLGYTRLYGVTTQVGADAAPAVVAEDARIEDAPEGFDGFRWLTLALFGEATGGEFERGVSRYPTVGDEVHLASRGDLEVIYGSVGEAGTIDVGTVADAAAVPARLFVAGLVSRHSCVFGSTGAGKSNLVSVIIDELSGPRFPSSRLLVVDPHGEYATAVPDRVRTIRTGPVVADGDEQLYVPYWALPFDVLADISFGPMQPHVLEAVRDRVRELKLEAAALLDDPPPIESVTADAPLPFSIRRLWFELQDVESATFSEAQGQNEDNKNTPLDPGDAVTLRPPAYPPATAYNTAPYQSKSRRGIGRQLDLLRTRLLDRRYAFMFGDHHPLHPDPDGRIDGDLHDVLRAWIGGPEPVTVLDVSGLPSDVLDTVVATMLQLVYDALFWSMELPVGGRQQPLLIVVDEAHRFVPEGTSSDAGRTFARIAKEGRKYGVGLMLVSQRPSDVAADVASQCGTVVALRVTNSRDRHAVAAAIPDDLGGLVDLLPALRTGEALVLGEALQVPSRVRIRPAATKPVGGDPALPAAWQSAQRPDPALYRQAVHNWRARAPVASADPEEGTS